MIKNICWKDIFKPRYAIVIEISTLPAISWDSDKQMKINASYFPVIMRLPYKRPLSMPFNRFYNDMAYAMGSNKKIFCGSRRTLKNIYGIGSCLSHNLDNAIMFNPDEYREDIISTITGDLLEWWKSKSKNKN